MINLILHQREILKSVSFLFKESIFEYFFFPLSNRLAKEMSAASGINCVK